jgi:hypothetical protein
MNEEARRLEDAMRAILGLLRDDEEADYLAEPGGEPIDQSLRVLERWLNEREEKLDGRDDKVK